MQKVHIKHETHRRVWIKFLLVVALFAGYLVFVSLRYGIDQGILITGLTWSFFVLCTPIADAGFLIDFPVRLILNLKMLSSEIFVWLIAIFLNLYTYFAIPAIYEKTKVLSLFKHILEKPFPFWVIIFISGIGTFLSVRFGDELLDVIKHKDRSFHKEHKLKWRMITTVFIFVLILIAYDFILKQLGVEIPL